MAPKCTQEILIDFNINAKFKPGESFPNLQINVKTAFNIAINFEMFWMVSEPSRHIQYIFLAKLEIVSI